MIKEYLRKIGIGLLYGIGFGIGASVLNTALSQYFWAHNIFSNKGQAEKKLLITNHRDIKRNNNIYILGTLENKTDTPVRAFDVQADFFDSNGTFIEQCRTYISTIPASSIYNFKIACDHCGKNPPVNYSSYKVYVNDGL